MNRRRQRGSMLIEAIIAMMVLIVVVAGFTTLTATKAAALGDAQARSLATRCADAEIARLRGLPFADLEKENNRALTLAGVDGGRGRVTVRKTDDGLREVRVRVMWRLRTGADETLVLYTLIGPEMK